MNIKSFLDISVNLKKHQGLFFKSSDFQYSRFIVCTFRIVGIYYRKIYSSVILFIVRGGVSRRGRNRIEEMRFIEILVLSM